MNIFKKTTSPPKKKRDFTLTRTASLVLRVGLPIILIYLSAFLVMICSQSNELPGYIMARIHFYTLEHIVMSAVLVISGGLLIDILERKISKND